MSGCEGEVERGASLADDGYAPNWGEGRFLHARTPEKVPQPAVWPCEKEPKKPVQLGLFQ